MPPEPQILVFPDTATLIDETARRVEQAALRDLSQRHNFTWFLSGGSTPKALYQRLAAEPYHSSLRWSGVEIFFGDERCVPPDHPDSNYDMAFDAMLGKLPIPESNIHRMRGEDPPEQAAIAYGQMLKSKFVGHTPDLILLGMGDDGHTASLFPNTPALHEQKHRCVANPVPQLNTTRLTLTAPFFNTAKQIFVIVTGAAKASRVREVLRGPRDLDRLPIQRIHPNRGELIWILDQTAASEL